LNKSLVPVLVCALALLVVSGCMSISYYSQTEKPALTGDLPEGYAFKQHITESRRNIYLVWGLIPFRTVEQNEIFAPYLKTGDGLANVRSKQEWDLISWLISGFSYGFVQTVHTEYEGDLIAKAAQ